MRFDIVTIFPEYLDPLNLSLIGKARERGDLIVVVHDLRAFATDRHGSVDDTAYGGGPGMVMSPEPWGEALDAVRKLADVDPVLVLPSASGSLFDQDLARQWSQHEWMVIACGRYEGIDARVAEHYRGRPDWLDVQEIAIGDFVLNGGEAAALVVVEAVARLVSGVVGNPASVIEESFGEDSRSALEGPQFTRPRTWRNLTVPDVLLSGDHATIAAWRAEQARERTFQVRPDLA